jgi:Transposase IS66 family
LAQLQKTLSTLLEQKRGWGAREFGEKLKMLFPMALELWEEYPTGAVKNFETRAAELRFVISYLLRARSLRDSDNQHLLKVRRCYHRWGELLRFLEDSSIEPTNNWVERALRPGVIARKVTQGSKNEAGADTFPPSRGWSRPWQSGALALWWRGYMPSSAPHKISPPQASPFKDTPLIKYLAQFSRGRCCQVQAPFGYIDNNEKYPWFPGKGELRFSG